MVWFDFFYLPRRVLGERHISRDRKIWKKTLRLLKVKFLKKHSFCRVSSINAASDVSIVDSSIERKGYTYGYGLCIAG